MDTNYYNYIKTINEVAKELRYSNKNSKFLSSFYFLILTIGLVSWMFLLNYSRETNWLVAVFVIGFLVLVCLCVCAEKIDIYFKFANQKTYKDYSNYLDKKSSTSEKENQKLKILKELIYKNNK